MPELAITVEQISKAYQIGLKEELPDTFVGAISGWLKKPVHNFRRLRRLDTFNRAVSEQSLPQQPKDSESPSVSGNRSAGKATASDDEAGIIWALRDISFEVREGEVLGIIGRNGSGKSTLLKILSRITEPTSGRAKIRGRVSSLLEVGTGFHPELTGRENVYMNGTILGMRKREIDRKFDEIASFSGVEKFLDTPVKRYSSGMKVRLAFSVAAHLEPEILIVDEVLAVGDAEFQNKCLGKMQGVAQSGRTVLFVSHNMAAVQSFCVRSLVLCDGQMDFEGDTESALRFYLARTNESNGLEFDLRSHATRKPNSVPILRSVRLLDGNGRPSNIFRSGESMTIEFGVDPLVPLPAPRFGVVFDDALGTRLFAVATHLSKSSISAITNPATIRCHIGCLPLAPGNYLLSFSAGTLKGYLDQLDRALAFEVQNGDFYGNGSSPGKHFGKMLVRSQWSTSNRLEISTVGTERECQ